ncbi:MAG TPA: chromosome segregation protein SMC [Gammaproteobacteria bacterium]|nr:chromosome segregation protein SMC [Gammaproteobacteria bacterium]
MRLKKIKLAGFKSFVDPTTIIFPSQLVGVVGPNGCGKSNVIDAVRWVLGESSAKHLRGDSLEDVIFNGSTSRKPVGQAFVELVFDNSDGSLGGQYARYSEIAIKRHLSRDGQSVYYLNGTRCRRRDITDIFLGTGLGPRSYAIIEQGTVSRLIEAKPEELRVFLEEVAGISKYKERRRETENRIRGTKENISRLNDLLSELEKRLDKLQRQAKTAERYKVVKQEEREVKAQLLALRWQALDEELRGREKDISSRETALEARVAELRAVEAELEKQREHHVEVNEAFNEVQGRYYSLGAEIARLEQSIQHATERLQKNQRDLAEVERAWQEIRNHMEQDGAEIEGLRQSLAQSEPELSQARRAEQASGAALAEAEEQMQLWQNEWDAFNARAAAQIQEAEVERTRIHHLEDQLLQLHERLQRLGEERNAVESQVDETAAAELGRELEALAASREETESELQSLLAEIAEQRSSRQQLTVELEAARRELQALQRRQATLEALQEAALGKQAGAARGWLKAHGLEGRQRLAESLEVAPGWERAVETVLGPYLEAVCVEDLAGMAGDLAELEEGSLTLLDTTAAVDAGTGRLAAALRDKVRAPWELGGLLAGVYIAEDLAGALALRPRLGADESVVTRQGLWLGPNWVRVSRPSDESAGILEREQALRELGSTLATAAARVAALEEELAAVESRGRELEERREQTQQRHAALVRQHAELQARLGSLEARQEQLRLRRQRLAEELGEVERRIEEDKAELGRARGRLEAVVAQTEGHEAQRNSLLERRDALRRTLEQCREQARNDRDRAREIALRSESMQAQLKSLEVGYQRMENQLANLGRQRETLIQALADGDGPINTMKAELETLLGRRLEVEQDLAEARRAVEACEHELRQLEERRTAIERQLEEMRAAMEQLRLAGQELRVRRQTLLEQLQETGFELQPLLEAMPEEASEAAWAERLEQIAQRIQRMGPINLAAIDEFQEQSQRKEYLDAQLADLNEALATLEGAIRKIDNETRARFRETFEYVNERLQALYPRLFGGGRAFLEMTSNDLLEAGVAIMAQPPGKRNGSIHLLSGGEKALTAIALVFAMFELNPAPFCMLDEVDAPLDDNNAARFCQLVKEMAQQVQFVVITHNKITMEMAQQLVGVTMHEPGVSRLVAVDVDEAVEMATA